MKKSIIVLSVVLGLIIVLLLIKGLRNVESDEKRLIKYLENSGYVLNEQEGTDFKTGEKQKSRVYSKLTSSKSLDEYLDDYSNNKNSEYSELFYDIDGNTFIKVVMRYEDEVSLVFKAEKKLDKNLTSYNYEISVLDSSIMLQGTYKDGDTAFDANNLTCDVSYTVSMDEEEKDTYCNISKLELLSFLEDINNFTDNKDIKTIVDKGISHK